MENTRTSPSVSRMLPPRSSRRRLRKRSAKALLLRRFRIRLQTARQLEGVAQAEIEALAGDRMQGLGRIAEQQHALLERSARDAQREGIDGPSLHLREAPGAAAEFALQCVQESVLRCRAQLLCSLGRGGPHQCVAGLERQQRDADHRAVKRSNARLSCGRSVTTLATSADWR